MPRLHRSLILPLLLASLATLSAACHGARVARPYADPGAEAVVAYLTSLRERVHTLRAETLSDARIGKDRANVTVYILAGWGGKLRYMAMNPGGGAMAADLASDGAQFCFVDANKNCGECGPATPENVGQLLRVVMQPDDVVTMMFGGTPVLAGAEPSLAWDPAGGHEVLTLVGRDGSKQRVVLDGVDHHWDVLESELKNPDGKLAFRIRHKDFHPVKTAAGQAVRVPGKSFFEQPGNDALIRWKEQELDVELDADKFHIDVDPNLPTCGDAKASGR
jgi:hypothetical protein